jgi:hypothetical protein
MLSNDPTSTAIRSAELKHPSPANLARDGPPLLEIFRGGKYASP